MNLNTLAPMTSPSNAMNKPAQAHTIEVRNLNAYYGNSQALKDISIRFEPGLITALIGPSGCGKSTMIRCLNRMHEVVKGAYATGTVLIGDEDIYATHANPVNIRRRIGMVFQKPNPFPTMSIYDNVIIGLKLNAGGRPGMNLDEIAEMSLRSVALWDEVKDKLKSSGAALSGGQQQRLCIARAIALEPDFLLLDEPCSALDPIATLKIEDLLQELRQRFTIILVTHNMQQAARTSDVTAFFLTDQSRVGWLVEYGDTARMFTKPSDRRTEDYIAGRFG